MMHTTKRSKTLQTRTRNKQLEKKNVDGQKWINTKTVGQCAMQPDRCYEFKCALKYSSVTNSPYARTQTSRIHT